MVEKKLLSMSPNCNGSEKPTGKKFLNGDIFFYKVDNSWTHSKYFLENNTKKGVTICLDFDGVIVDPAELKSRFLKKAGFQINPEESSRQKCLARNVPLNQYREISSLVATQHLMEMPIEDGAIEGIRQLIETNEIYIVTSRNTEETKAVIEFIEYHNISVDGIVSVNDRSKLNALAVIEANYFLDDSLSKLLALIDETTWQVVRTLGKCKLLLYKNITNKDDSLSGTPIKKVKLWENIVQIINDELSQ
jgi:uncharacterized HAD superfamily protein